MIGKQGSRTTNVLYLIHHKGRGRRTDYKEVSRIGRASAACNGQERCWNIPSASERKARHAKSMEAIPRKRDEKIRLRGAVGWTNGHCQKRYERSSCLCRFQITYLPNAANPKAIFLIGIAIIKLEFLNQTILVGIKTRPSVEANGKRSGDVAGKATTGKQTPTWEEQSKSC
ncbi:hypothetical protein Tco_0603492 [Tanacetum coccineum]